MIIIIGAFILMLCIFMSALTISAYYNLHKYINNIEYNELHEVLILLSIACILWSFFYWYTHYFKF